MDIDCNMTKPYEIQFEEADSAILAKRKFKHVKAFTGRNRRTYCLCTECKTYLDEEYVPTKEERFMDKGWCSFVWYILSNESLHEHYGDEAWRMIPTEWRPWWLDSLKHKYPDIFDRITLQFPAPIFVDKTNDLMNWKKDIESYFIARLASTTNKYLRPVIKCPWGCSEFPHKAGNIPFDILLQRLFQRCILKMMTSDAQSHHKKVCYYYYM